MTWQQRVYIIMKDWSDHVGNLEMIQRVRPSQGQQSPNARDILCFLDFAEIFYSLPHRIQRYQGRKKVDVR